MVNDYPGLSVQGFFEAGKEVGNTKLNINVRNEERFFANFRLDNHGTDETGQNRIYSDFLWNNPTGTADQLHLGALATFSPANTLYGQIRYNSHIIDPRLNFSLGYANNAFILGEGESEAIDALDLEGETYIKDVAFTYKALRSRKKNYSWLVGFESIESEIRLKALPNDGGGLLDDEVENITLGLNFEILQETSKMLHQGNIRVKQGEFLRGAEIGQDENYTVFQADYSLLSFWTLPFTENIETRSTIRLQLQYSDSALSSINQFSTGGPLRARGFESQEFSGDQGAYLGIDWFLNLPEFMNMEVGYTDLKNIIYPFLFVDSAYGRLLSLTDGSEPDISTLVNAGFGFQFAYDNQLSGKLQVAFPIENKFESSLGVSNDDDDDSIFLFEIQYTL
ncbi:MAG: ShlB/FhaC/HecB family hemolysin secretion/activation protein [Pseudomonadota bacterium]